MVEEGVEGVPLCVTWGDTGTGFMGTHGAAAIPVRPEEEAAPAPQDVHACLEPFLLLPEPEGACWQGAQPRKRCSQVPASSASVF